MLDGIVFVDDDDDDDKKNKEDQMTEYRQCLWFSRVHFFLHCAFFPVRENARVVYKACNLANFTPHNFCHTFYPFMIPFFKYCFTETFKYDSQQLWPRFWQDWNNYCADRRMVWCERGLILLWWVCSVVDFGKAWWWWWRWWWCRSVWPSSSSSSFIMLTILMKRGAHAIKKWHEHCSAWVIL